MPECLYNLFIEPEMRDSAPQMKIYFAVIIPIILLLFPASSSPANAREDESEKANHIALFMGANSLTSAGSRTSASLGLDYERRIVSSDISFGTGAYLEGSFGKSTEFVFGVPAVLHFAGGPKFWLAPSYAANLEKEELTEAELDPASPGFKNVHYSSSAFFMRFGTGWDFEFDNFTLTPSLSADIISSKTYLAWGINFGYAF